MRRLLVAALAMCVLGGCGEAAEPAVPAQVVESSEPVWGEDPLWSVNLEAELVIGVSEGPEELMFHRVTGVARLSTGEHVVADSGSGELRFFDESGRFLRATGGHGQGPGEFGQFSSVLLWVTPAGHLVASDAGNGRVNVYDLQGNVVDTLVPEPMADASRLALRGVFDDGRLLFSSPEGGGRLRGAPGTIIRMKRGYYLYDGVTGVRELMRLEGRRRYVNADGDIIHYPFLPFSPEPLSSVGAQLYVVPEQQPELHVIDPNGRVVRRYEWLPGHARPTHEVWSAYQEAVLASITDEERRERYARYFRKDLPVPDRVPSYERLLRDGTGAFWVQRYRMDSDEPLVFDVLDADGRWLGTLPGPRSFTPYHVTEQAMVGVHRDELGLQTVHVYGVDRDV